MNTLKQESGPKAVVSRWLLVGLLLLGGTPAVGATDEESIVAIIAAIEQGWENGDGTPFREHYLDVEEARYFEGGGQNEGLADLIEHHVEPEGDAFEGFDLTFSNIRVYVEGPAAWAVVDSELVATVKRDNRQIHKRGHGTFVFRAVDGEWKVVHTHSSSRSVKSDMDQGHDH